MVYAVYKICVLFLRRICDAIFDFSGFVTCSTLSDLSGWSPIGQIKPYQIGPFWDISNCASASFPLTTWLLWALVFQQYFQLLRIYYGAFQRKACYLCRSTRKLFLQRWWNICAGGKTRECTARFSQWGPTVVRQFPQEACVYFGNSSAL